MLLSICQIYCLFQMDIDMVWIQFVSKKIWRQIRTNGSLLNAQYMKKCYVDATKLIWLLYIYT